MSDNLRWRLRNSTELRHTELDKRLSALQLDRRADYSRFLLINAATLPIEALLEAAGIEDDLPDWPGRARRAALLADLADLGLASDERAAAPLQAPDLDAPAARLGLAYVLEGSRLGATVLKRTPGASPDPAVRAATRYLTHGEGRGFWPSYLARLNAVSWTPQDSDLATAAACWGFDQYLARTGALTGEAV